MLKELFSLTPTHVECIPLHLFDDVSLDFSRMLHCHQYRTQNFILNTNLAVLLNLDICDHCAHFPYFCRIFSILSQSYTVIQFSVNASIKLILGCARLFARSFRKILEKCFFRLHDCWIRDFSLLS